MDQIYREVFRKCYSFLVANIEYDDICDLLIQYEVIPEMIAEDIDSLGNNRRAKVRKLIDFLSKRSNETFATFVKCLTESKQGHVAKTITDKLNEMGMIRPPEIQGCATSSNETGACVSVAVACSEPCEQVAMEEDQYCPLLPGESASSPVCYEMNSNPRGFVLIINNETFTQTLEDRFGSTKDANDLRVLFCNFGFYCDVKHNLTVDEMKQHLLAFSNLDEHKRQSCCVVILMSHGEEDHIYGSGCQSVPIKELIVYFSDHNCPNLKNKPKLFIIQACRSYKTLPKDGRESPTNNSSSSTLKPPLMRLESFDLSSFDAVVANTMNPHPHADMLLAYSTAIGNKSFRSTTSGSLFIQNIIEVFREKAHTTSVTDMLIEVNGRLRERYGDLQQLSAPEVVLTKKWYLNPVQNRMT